MAISFNQVPANARVPFVYAELDNSRAAATSVEFKSLLIGQRLATGNVAKNVLTSIADASAATAAFGRGSMLEHMCQAFRRNNPTGELWAIAVDDAAAATKATATITATAGATAAGTIALYIAGRRVAVGITSGDDTAAKVAARINAAIDAVDDDLPVTTAAAAAVVTLTARHGGTATELDVRINHYPDEALPAGVALTIAAGAAGATDPALDDALDAAAVDTFNIIASPYTAAALMTDLEDELADRWDPTRQIDGMAIAAYRGAAGTQAQATTYGNARNSQFVSIMDAGKFPHPGYEIAAAIAGAASASAEIDPARPFQTLELKGILAPKVGDRRTFTEQNTLLHDGISTSYIDAGGRVRIQRLITTYQKNASDVPDASYLNVNTLLTLSYIRTDLRQSIQAKYARAKLADDGTRIGAGQAVITPKIGRAEAIARFEEWEGRGLVEGIEQFKRDLIVERNAGNPDRLDFLVSPDLVNQFRIGGVKIAFLV